MKAIMAVLTSMVFAMVFAIALVPCASAATFAPANNMSGAVCQANSAAAGLNGSVTASVAPAGSGYACVSSPAYTSYVLVHPVTCSPNGAPLHTPSVMGTW